jgi:hypothetical protein
VDNKLGIDERRLRISRVAAGLCSVVAVVTAGAVGAQQALTWQQNMEKQKKEHIPGKELRATGPNYEFCEVAPIMGTSKENAVVNFYIPTGVDHCTPEQFAEIVKEKDKIIKETGALDVFLNPSRRWTWDEVTLYVAGDEKQFGPVKFAWEGVVGPADEMEKAVGKGHYHPGNIYRNDTMLWKKGSPVYLLDMPDGKVLVMQSWTHFVNKGETADNLEDLGSQFKELPPGWKFRVKTLDKDLTITPPPPGHLAWVTQDEFLNTYEGCGYDTACNYVP